MNVSQDGRYYEQSFDVHEHKTKERANHCYLPIMPAGPQAEVVCGVADMNSQMAGYHAQLADLGMLRVDVLANDLPKEHRSHEPEAERGRSRARGGGSVRRGNRQELRERSSHCRRDDTRRHGMVMPNDDNTIAASWHDVGTKDDHMAAGLSSLKDGQAHRSGPNFNPKRSVEPRVPASRDYAKFFETTQTNIQPKLTERVAPSAATGIKPAATSSLGLMHSRYAPGQLEEEAKVDRRKMVALQAKFGEETAAKDALEQAQSSLFRYRDAAAKIQQGLADLNSAEEDKREKKKTELAVLVSENWLDLLEMQKDAQEKLACLPDLAGSKWAS